MSSTIFRWSAVAVVLMFCALPAWGQTLKTDEAISAMGYQHLYQFNIPDQPNLLKGATYAIDNSAAISGPIESVAYRLNLGNDFAFVSMDAFAASTAQMGVPTFVSGAVFQKYVSNMYYETKSASLTTAGTTVPKGNIEFWPQNYSAGNAIGIPGANGGTYDFGDSRAVDGTHGSMQVHDYQNNRTVFAFNNWNAGAVGTLGVGTCPNPVNNGYDWTFTSNANAYATRQLDVYVKPLEFAATGDQLDVIKNETANMSLVYKLDIPLYGKLDASSYSIDNSASVKGMPLKRTAYYMELTKADGATDYAYVSYDALGNTPATVGLPFNGEIVQTKVNNMTVQSNVDGVVNGTGITTGNVEFWNCNYSGNSSLSMGLGGTNNFDYDDTAAAGNYASFQIHNYGDKQTVMALNRWNGVSDAGNEASGTLDIGIGNNKGLGSQDYTFNASDSFTAGVNSNASQYETRKLYAMVETAIAPGMDNVSNAADYTLVQGARISAQMNTQWNAGNIAYDIVDNVASLKASGVAFDRVGYYMEYAKTSADPLQYVFVSFDAMTTDISKVGVPVFNANEFYQQVVKNMEITTNVPATEGILTDKNTGTQAAANTTFNAGDGYLEFWPSNYASGKSGVVTAGSDAIYDINDSDMSMNAGHGSMQVHNLDTGNTVFAINSFNGTKQYGIGTNPNASANNANGQADWTFDTSKQGYEIANIYMFVRELDYMLTTTEYSMFQRDANNMAQVKLSGNWGASEGNNISQIQASVDGGDWMNLTLNSDGTFSGSTALAGGLHNIDYQGLDATGNVVVTDQGVVGVGEIFITAGQSNSANHGDAPQSSTSGQAFAYNPNTGQWQISQDPQPGATGNAGSTWPAFSDALSDDLGVPVGTYSVGYGGSNINSWWNPDTDAAGAFYTDRLLEAINTLQDDGTGFAGILWHQGESNAGSTQAYYEEALRGLIELSRTDAGFDVPWGVALASCNGSFQSFQQILDAQMAVILDDPLVFLGPNTDELERQYRGNGGNSIHFSIEGLTEVGQLWAMLAAADIVAYNNRDNSVPEPATWAMMILGLVLIGYRARLTRRGKR